MRNIVLGIVVAAPLFAVAPAVAQQIVDTTTGVRHASGQCSVTEAMLAAIEQGQADRQVDTKARLDAFIDNALASSRTAVKTEGQSPVVFPPVRSGG
ncbi:MAG: hypothetical protein O3B37_01165 [Proteobacteria bacterium]|nr:hypothetical protein [Pseudomonadota bacterium]